MARNAPPLSSGKFVTAPNVRWERYHIEVAFWRSSKGGLRMAKSCCVFGNGGKKSTTLTPFRPYTDYLSTNDYEKTPNGRKRALRVYDVTQPDACAKFAASHPRSTAEPFGECAKPVRNVPASAANIVSTFARQPSETDVRELIF